MQIIDYYEIKNVNSFAKDYLKYDSSEKINRLKKDNTYPSFEILSDITNKFENIDANWLLTGIEPMFRDKKIEDVASEKIIPVIDNSSMGFILDRFEALAAENALLKKENEDLKQTRGKRIGPIPYTENSPELSTSIAAEPANK